jgi:VanW like protein/Glycosyl transferases group 1
VQNLRVAAAALNGLIIPAGEVFSFWKHVGRPVKSRGFVPGRELREGCVIPSIGGGLCQLSNALYGAALDANCEIVERHAHSRILPGSMAAEGRDATVFWNYVDLRFRSAIPLRLEVRLTQRELVVRMHDCDSLAQKGAAAPCQEPQFAGLDKTATAAPEDSRTGELEAVESCETCGVASCFRHGAVGNGAANGKTAWLVDAWWPEFDDYIQKHRAPADWLLLPLDGARWRVGSYRWKTLGFSRVRQAPWEVMIRSLVSRRLSAQGAERQRALLRFDEALARRYARALPFSATHLVVSLNLLPFLWRDGVLGGRTFDVLMTRQPLAALQSALDCAHEMHPGSRTLRDFRVSPELVAAESEALAEARHWITPHRGVAKLGGSRSVLLDWALPEVRQAEGEKTRVVFPASTLGRKGAYELREVAKRLGLRLALGGAVIEEPQFWGDLDTTPASGHWLSGARVVVLPAWVEHQPRRLLQAIAAGVPVIASQACGLEGVSGVVSIPEGDAGALEVALQQLQAR